MPLTSPSVTMESAEYDRMADSDESMWWYRALHRHVIDALLRASLPDGATILDAGCGTGGLLRRMAREVPGSKRIGLEYHLPAVSSTRQRAACPAVQGSVNRFPFRDGCMDAVVLTDVLSQEGAMPSDALGEAHRVLGERGLLVSNEPAYDWLRSYHDRRVGIERRFSRHDLRILLEEAGFETLCATHWNTLLFPLAVLRRKLFSKPDSPSDVRSYGSFLERVFGLAMELEHRWLESGRGFCFGLSILLVGRKLHGT